jgi:hypothetical protein
MSTKKLGALALLVTLPLAALGVAGVAEAAAPSQATISAKVSDTTPASGQEFAISGTFTEDGAPAARHIVKVQAQQANGSWKTLTGARERTNAAGAYDLAVVLGSKGARDLRVVGVGGDAAPNATRVFTVTVH